ncbi:MAG: hypothetical protein ACI9FJ_002184 [Alteromonadaceae bacterium]
MTNNYRETVMDRVEQAAPDLSGQHRLTFKPCFGAVAGYIDDKVFITCGKFGLALRLPGATLTGLFASGQGSALKYFEKGHIKKEYAVLCPTLLEDEAGFRQLLQTAISYVDVLAKPIKAKSTKSKP